jgi:Flp pilus assembly protein TadG
MSSKWQAGDDLGRGIDSDGGNAVIEFIFVAVLIMVPLVYLIVAVASVQRSRLAVSNAARDVGRAIASDPTGGDTARAQAALRVALANQGLTPADVQVRLVASGDLCDAQAITPELTPGSEFTVCVIRRQRLPGVPSLLAGGAVTTVGRYLVHLDDYRATTERFSDLSAHPPVRGGTGSSHSFSLSPDSASAGRMS